MIQGRKINNEQIFTLDGQRVNDDAKPLKVAPSLIKEIKKEKKPQPIVETKKTPKENVRKAQTKKPEVKKPLTTITNTPKENTKELREQSSSPDSPVAARQPVTRSVSREPRVFKPLSEQFPNLMSTIFQQKQFKNDSPSRASSSSSQSSFEEPNHLELKPEKNPAIEKRVQQVVTQNNKNFVQSKAEQRKAVEDERLRKLDQRNKMKEYGKQQIVRAHTQQECFENKYAWGVNQSKVKDDQLRSQRREQQPKEKKSQQVEISKLFPESQGRQSRFKRIWEEEARNASRKETYSLSAKKQPQSQEQRKALDEDSEYKIQTFQAKVQQDAEIALKAIHEEKLKKQQQQLMKKHKIEYIDREAKAILKKTKKKAFHPDETFDYKASQVHHSKITIIPEKESVVEEGVRDLFETAELDAEDFVDNKEAQKHQKRIKGGKVMTNREYNAFQEQQKAKKAQIQQVKQTLKPQDHITLKNAQYSKEELQLKKQISQPINIQQKVDQAQKGLLKQSKSQSRVQPTEFIQPDLEEFIFQEAELPKFEGEDYQLDERTDFRHQVEEEIKAQILKVKKKQRVQPQQKYVDPKKPQSREQPKFRSQCKKFISQPRYPVAHDLGEVGMLEEDLYNAQHGNWQPQRIVDLDSDSEKEDTQGFIKKSGIFKQSQSIEPQKKSVAFRTESGEYLTEQKEKLQKLIEKYSPSQIRQKKQQTSDESSDDGLNYGQQIWLPSDPINRDIFIMSSKELMQLRSIEI